MIYPSCKMQIVLYKGSQGKVQFLYWNGQTVERHDSLSPGLLLTPENALKTKTKVFVDNPLLPEECITIANVEIHDADPQRKGGKL
jgi:hypothetical protein